MEFEIEAVTADEELALMRRVREVWGQMEHREWFAVDGETYMRDLLRARRGMVRVAVEREARALAGVLIVVWPGLDEENLGYDVGLSGEELLRVAHIDVAVVMPPYRGCGLQSRMTLLAEEELAAAGYRYLMSTVHPDNLPSCRNMERCGYRCVRQTTKYGGLPRRIYLKAISTADVPIGE